MQATELRIGNYVFDCEGYVDKVTAIITPQIDNEKNCYPWLRGTTAIMLDNFVGAHNVDAIRPIPLSEEWLLKFGWIWNDECNSYEKYPNGDARMNLSYRSINNSYTMFNYVLKATISEKIWYVHQLQNLYFALTGEELTLKSE